MSIAFISAASLLHSSGLAAPALWMLLAAAVVGTASSTVFFAMAMAAAARNLRLAKAQRQAIASVPIEELPPVTVLKPVHGAEPRLEENLESFFQQDYPAFELVFGCRTEDDAALKVVEQLCHRYPQVNVRVVLSGSPLWPSAKVWSLDRMIASTRNRYLVISDSDVLVRPDFLRNIIPPLLDPANGAVTCLYAGIPAAGLWSRLEALGMSVEMPSGVMTADMLEGMRFALGAVIAVRRDALDEIGGIEAMANYYSDDFVLGNLMHAAGYRVVLSHYRVGHVLCAQGVGQTFATQIRWMQSTRYSRPRGHLGSGLTYAMPFGLLGLTAASAMGEPMLGAALLGVALLNRMAQSAIIGGGVVGDGEAVKFCWLYPMRDLLGFFIWAASYFKGDSFIWRGEHYRFTPGGRIVSVERAQADSADLTAILLSEVNAQKQGVNPGHPTTDSFAAKPTLRTAQLAILQVEAFSAPDDGVSTEAGKPDGNADQVPRRNQP